MCSFVWKYLFVCQNNIFLCFGGKLRISFLKNPILGDLTALYIQWLTYKCCFFFFGFLLMLLITGLLKNDSSSVVATLATVGNLFFIGKIPK